MSVFRKALLGAIAAATLLLPAAASAATLSAGDERDASYYSYGYRQSDGFGDGYGDGSSAGDLLFHSAGGGGAIVDFTASRPTAYNGSGFFQRLDTSPLLPGDVRSPSAAPAAKNGEYTYDTRGLTLLLSAVPEPATWALLILGTGAVAGGLRVHRRGRRVRRVRNAVAVRKARR